MKNWYSLISILVKYMEIYHKNIKYRNKQFAKLIIEFFSILKAKNQT